ncbi:sensor histidine kinase [Candidatus Methylacidithermus pantelleriae]|uniref:histidine kinase n=1 Tax=Candidatus Methylacidithermus pantelleriae TaxID=2744239 RepID=A0A8J2BPT5_9BACT|nr:ATP-binding protein [Candidatus Methylacidithermus pantelleriae]CAF0702118.1 PAS domain S-box-containing protein [Candidatus Methylacidithermus pantelleriae]
MRNAFLNKLLHRIERLGPSEIQTYLQRLVREKGFLETIFNTLQEGVLVVDRQGKVIYGNQSVERLLGISPEEILGKPVERYIDGLDWKEVLEGEKIVSRDLEVHYPESRYLTFYAVPLEGGMQSGSAFVVIFHDITASREKTLEMIEWEKLGALTLLAAAVAHELGNPLNSLSIHVELLARDLARLGMAEHPAIAESLQVIRSEMRRLDAILERFLGAIRPTTPKLVPVRLGEILEQSVEFFRPELEDREITLEWEVVPDLGVVVLGDRDRIKQAFYNVIKNALEAIGRKGCLRIETTLTETHCVVSFSDTGGGIPPEQMGRVFEPYFTTKPAGTGLGLLVVRRVMQEHKGKLELKSELGKGTTVRLFFPLGERRLRALPLPSQESHGDGHKRKGLCQSEDRPGD